MTRTEPPSSSRAARQRLVRRRGARDLVPAGPRRAARARPPRPSRTRGRGGRAAPSAPRRSGAPDGRPAGPRQLADPRAELVGEVRRRGADERVDVVAWSARASGTRALLLASSGAVRRRVRRRPDAARDRLLWALNFTVTKYVARARLPAARLRASRYGAAAAALLPRSPIARERSLRVARRDIAAARGRRRVAALREPDRVRLRADASRPRRRSRSSSARCRSSPA